jgi:hypothetical protein
MTIHREWQHSWAYPDAQGVARAGASVSGNVVLVAGGYAELILSDSSNENSTDTTGNTATDYFPIIGVWGQYESSTDLSHAVVAFKAQPYARIRAHIYLTWET